MNNNSENVCEESAKLNSDSLEEKSKNLYEYSWFFVILTPIIPFFGIVLVKFLGFNFEDLGPFGDFISGSSVPILTFSSFLLVSATLLMQQHQLNLQKEELRLTREEYSKTNEAFFEQNKMISIQRFENTFFQLISLHNEILQAIKIGNKLEGRQSFSRLYNYLSFAYREKFFELTEYNDYDPEALKTHFIAIQRGYEEFFKQYQDVIGHYFRNLYRIVKFIHENKILEEEEKLFYVGILRAQLSTHEHILLFYNSLSKYGAEKFLPLIKKYKLLDGLNHSLLYHPFHYDIFLNYNILDEIDKEEIN
jgi:Putative phage abortive infection protein